MLLLLNVNVYNYVICNIHLKPPLTQTDIYFKSHINYYHSFFYMNGVSVHMKPMNPLTETAPF